MTPASSLKEVNLLRLILRAKCLQFLAAVQARRAKADPSNDMFSLEELDWFSRNTYNLALRILNTWQPEQTIRLVRGCIKVKTPCSS